MPDIPDAVGSILVEYQPERSQDLILTNVPHFGQTLAIFSLFNLRICYFEIVMGSPNIAKAMVERQQGKVMDVTGEHIGRLVGRSVGDEVGALGGLAAANIVANNMGWASEEDRMIEGLKAKIKELESNA